MRASLAGRSGATTVPVGAALLVLASGFGALLAFWLGGPHPAALPGLFDFTSATWGDGLLLPVMTGLLGYAVRTLPAAPGDLRLALAGAPIGGMLGVGSQAWWLIAARPRPNWTLPAPHTFTAAGWYHAAFVATVCTSIAALLGVLLNRSTAARRWPPAATLGIATGVAFIALLVVDARAGTSPDTGRAGVAGTLLGLAVTAVAAVVLIRRRAAR